jgi:hypothetical protein
MASTWKRETSLNDGLQFEIDGILRNVSNPTVYSASDARAPITGRHWWGLTSQLQHRLWRQQNSRMPTTVCAVPAVVMVSLTETEADYEVKTDDLPGWMLGRSYMQTVAWAKVLVKTEWVNSKVRIWRGTAQRKYPYFAMRCSVPTIELSSTICAYLTFMSDMKNWFADPGQLTSMASTFEV